MAFRLVLLVDQYSEAVHLALLELSNINVPVGELEFALTVLLSIAVMSLILSAIGPLRLAFSLDAALDKLTGIGFLTFLEIVGAYPVEEPVLKVALVI